MGLLRQRMAEALQALPASNMGRDVHYDPSDGTVKRVGNWFLYTSPEGEASTKWFDSPAAAEAHFRKYYR